ncbi:hypothetical protein [Streptomyces synnematoformans]|uniref:hypothetical protein n=1 Tax=Streptomyces synnematoformans TaxID=415721 RepID=UPI0031D12872
MVITDVRLVVVGFSDDDTSRDEPLWEVDQSVVAQVERKKFSKGERNFRITFTDGSWCRFHSYSESAVNRILRHLSSTFLPLDQLTPAQQNAISIYLAECSSSEQESGGSGSVYPYGIVTRRPSGNLLFEAWSDPAHSVNGLDGCTMHLISPEGGPPNLQPGDLD